jgi:ABC-type Fe3+ transport system substrate-binding protein
MKHILPILTITTLAAAASAQSAAAPAGLSYNRVTVSREGQNTSLSASAFLGSSNVLATIGTTTAGTSYELGYVFKNVAAGIDATVSVGAGSATQNSDIGLNLRRSLSEVVAGLEIAVGVTYNSGAGAAASTQDYTYELSYNINKQFSVAYGITDQDGAASNLHTVSVRYNF